MLAVVGSTSLQCFRIVIASSSENPLRKCFITSVSICKKPTSITVLPLKKHVADTLNKRHQLLHQLDLTEVDLDKVHREVPVCYTAVHLALSTHDAKFLGGLECPEQGAPTLASATSWANGCRTSPEKHMRRSFASSTPLLSNVPLRSKLQRNTFATQL